MKGKERKKGKTMDKNELYSFMREPLGLAKILWPDVVFYREQREIIESVRKDFVAGFI
jgi:hypothetical protein